MKTGEQLKLEGLQRAATKHAHALGVAQNWAMTLGRDGNGITSDDVMAVLDKYGITLGNAAGSIFADARWERIGFRKSVRPSAHSRIISIWRLK